jgi:signal transduction histidine kinase
VEIRDDLRYTPDHEWLRVESGEAVIGITAYAADQLGDVVFVELPAPGMSLDAAQAAALGNIKVASKALLRVINDVLDLSKIEAGEMHLERAPFSPQTLLREVAELMSAAAAAKGLDFVVDVPASLPALLEGDATRLHQVLTNLLSNAIKFTDRGRVRLAVQALPAVAGASGARLRFAVEDSGIGIEPEALKRLFTPFV